MKFFEHFFLLLFIFIAGCSKPDPNPELKDPIFIDLNTELASITQQLESEKALLVGHEKELEEAPPQTGKIKFALKRVSESKNKIHHLTQEQSFLRLKIETRRATSKSLYLKAYNTKSPWPDPKEWDSYSAEKRLRQAKKVWDVKQRIKDLGLEGDGAAEKKKSGH